MPANTQRAAPATRPTRCGLQRLRPQSTAQPAAAASNNTGTYRARSASTIPEGNNRFDVGRYAAAAAHAANVSVGAVRLIRHPPQSVAAIITVPPSAASENAPYAGITRGP